MTFVNIAVAISALAVGGKVKILSLGSPHGGKPPLAPLTDRNKLAMWAATPREAGWIMHRASSRLSSFDWVQAYGADGIFIPQKYLLPKSQANWSNWFDQRKDRNEPWTKETPKKLQRNSFLLKSLETPFCSDNVLRRLPMYTLPSPGLMLQHLLPHRLPRW